ncbi:hypothetical protein PPL_06504 [Heterostelium album PN500]|uniref:Uncharacterized protein n=1 Tax=Heterostelium pallidum (strain ATCC 26659 / Pp 5 / PN500) TaxID=670386 RepID=D3BDC1_HETP5|nr:hypothetical protein PPL_06504 [Heterostelium album PN500]EFA80565.1 hypothetical protein PPL_06504 [Heterostelium album PN500]|eukprot:XP_020432685.1 hypothetical protein PPL_06504 [Heterostelium album PN500]
MMSNNNNNNHNQRNILVNLSHLLLSKIINYLDDNADRIVFTLVCKRWFIDRHRYLSFNISHIKKILNDVLKNNMFLNSYESIYLDSINRKNKYRIVVFKTIQNSPMSVFTMEKLRQIKEIHPNVDQVISTDIESSDLEELYRMICRSNVTDLSCQTLRYRLPDNLTSLSFAYDFDEPLLPGSLPPNLKNLDFSFSKYKQPIQKGLLPNTLEKLHLCSSRKTLIEPGVLPSSLKVLSYNGNNTLKVGSLPPNLEEFNFYGDLNVPISEGVLPLSLHTLSVPFQWLPLIKSLSNLKSLSLLGSGKDDIVDLSYLPSSLTDLQIGGESMFLSTIPPSIKSIGSIYPQKTDSLFKDRSEYQLDYLSIVGYKQGSLNGLKIKELDIFMDVLNPDIQMDELKDLPDGIEKLYIAFQSDIPINLKDIPSSVRTLTLNSLDSFDVNTFPNTLEELVIDDVGEYDDIDDQLFDSDLLPSTLQSLTLPSLLLPQPRIPNNLIIKTVELKNTSDKITLRRLDDHHFLFSEESCFMCAIVHESQIPNIFSFYESKIPKYMFGYLPRWNIN